MQHFERCSNSETFDDTSARSGNSRWHQSVPQSTKSSKDLFCCNERWEAGDLQNEWRLLPSPSLGLSGTVHEVTTASAIDPLGADGIFKDSSDGTLVVLRVQRKWQNPATLGLVAGAIATLVQNNGVDVGATLAPHVSGFLLGLYQNIAHARRMHFRMEHECTGLDGSVTSVFGVPKAPGNLITDWVLLQHDLVLECGFLQ